MAAAVIRPTSHIMTLGGSSSSAQSTMMFNHHHHHHHHHHHDATAATAAAAVMRPLQPQQQPNHNAQPSSLKCIKPKSSSSSSTSSTASTASGGSSSAGSFYQLQLAGRPGQPYPTRQPQTVSVQRRNARERNRVKQVNNGFSTLRQHIPGDVVAALSNGGGRGASKKLSKVDTLKVAVEYIRRLEDLLDEVVNDENASGGAGASGGSAYQYGNVSPTPSYASSSVDSSVSSQSSQSSLSSSSSALPHIVAPPPPYKYETDEPAESAYDPDDEELLDCITWWQQQ